MSDFQTRPSVTLALFTYNQEKFVREAVDGALNQDYANLEVIISDDCSTDSTFAVINSVAREYLGPHKIVINRNLTNLGLTRHFSNIVRRARGDLIVLAAGDDISLPTRVSKTVKLFESDPKATIVSFSSIEIDENGRKIGRVDENNKNIVRKVYLKDYLTSGAPSISGASRSLRKEVFDFFGDLNDKCPTEDTPYILRGLMMGHALVSSDCGIFYRKHGNNLSGLKSIHNMNIEEIKKQYLRDAIFAHEAGIIVSSQLLEIKDFSERNFRRRKISADFYKSFRKMEFYLKEIMVSKDFGFREKISMLLDAVRHWFSKGKGN